MRLLFPLALLWLAGCGGSSARDAGSDADSGPDVTEVPDSSLKPDAFKDRLLQVRIAHLVPDGPPLRACLSTGSAVNGHVIPSSTEAPSGLRFGDVSEYRTFVPLVTSVLLYRADVFDAQDQPTCEAARTGLSPWLEDRVPTEFVYRINWITVGIAGIAAVDAGVDAGDGRTAPRAAVVEGDAITLFGKIRVRVYHAVTGEGPRSFCFEATDTEPVPLGGNVAHGETDDYVVLDPWEQGRVAVYGPDAGCAGDASVVFDLPVEPEPQGLSATALPVEGGSATLFYRASGEGSGSESRTIVPHVDRPPPSE